MKEQERFYGKTEDLERCKGLLDKIPNKKAIAAAILTGVISLVSVKTAHAATVGYPGYLEEIRQSSSVPTPADNRNNPTSVIDQGRKCENLKRPGYMYMDGGVRKDRKTGKISFDHIYNECKEKITIRERIDIGNKFNGDVKKEKERKEQKETQQPWNR